MAPWSPASRREQLSPVVTGLGKCGVDLVKRTAVEVLILLADRDQHRAPSVPDLITTATAELAGLTILHLDKNFDVIAGVTGQPR